ncbi:alpha/beta fold hydrolase [Cellulomonas pakistanensis]|uniref:Alpha/beta hydrolase n=1 Tax=Cellulomonas pakistanensis TaxID=992287 RepID=A0A919P7H5_9CELL|nr:alpha/beta hydrolase [Cellulomonas pakistanensis]GIG35023.1 alpha/beta hydrolase [Cellulomonas pakistanensis]
MTAAPADPRRPALRTATADDGTALRWQEQGAGAPVLLLQGQATPMAGWDPVAAVLATAYRVLRTEQRGTGGTEPGPGGRPPEGLSTRDLARDARAVLDAAGVDRAHVVGHSMGGKVAQWLAVDAPDRVASLVLLATSAGAGDGVPRDADAHRLLLGGDPAERVRLFFGDAWAAAHRDDVRTFFALDADRPTLRALYRASTEHDALADLHRVGAPTLVVHGTEDRLARLASAERLAAEIPGAELVAVAGAGHGLHLDSAEAAAAVRAFLRRHATG